MKIVFGKPVLGLQNLFDREEIHAIAKSIAEDLQPYAFIGPRRVGKTSMLYAIAEILRKKGIFTVFIDLEEFVGEEKLTLALFARAYSLAVIEELSTQLGIEAKLKILVRETPAKIIAVLSSLAEKIKKIKFRAAASTLFELVNAHMEFEISFEREAKYKESAVSLLSRALDIPEEFGRVLGKKVVVFIDEFQYITQLRPAMPGIFHLLRSKFQHHKNVGYVISGSATGMLISLIAPKEQPFHLFFLPHYVKPFDEYLSKEFLKIGLKHAGIKFEESAIDEIVSRCDGIPAWLSYVGKKCQDKAGKRKLTAEIAKGVVKELYSDPLVKKMLQSDLLKLRRAVRSERIIDVLILLAKQRYTPSELASHLQAKVGPIVPTRIYEYLQRLIDFGYVERTARGDYEVIDPIFREYLRKL